MTEYEEYLKRYCDKHKISKTEAESHALVKEYKKIKELENAKTI